MKGRRDEVLTLEAAERLLASLPVPDNCDGCGVRLTSATRETHSYGPFKVHVCSGCKLKWLRHDLRTKRATP